MGMLETQCDPPWQLESPQGSPNNLSHAALMPQA